MKKRTSNRAGMGPLKNTSRQLLTDDQSMAEILNEFSAQVLRKKILRMFQKLNRDTVVGSLLNR